MHWRCWQAVGADSWTVSVLRDGYRLPFESPPPLTRTPILFPAYRPGSPQSLALHQEIEKMLAKGALEIVPDPGPGFYSRLFLVEKATGGWRPVIDLSTLNTFIRQTPFKMETVASVFNAVQENDLLPSLDLKDAYFQVPVHPSSRKFLRFVSQGTVYQFKVLCFGLSTAPQVFTRVFAAVSAWAHTRGIRLLRYLDDWLVLASSKAKARQHVQELLLLCHDLGIVVNEKKSDLVPSRSASYLRDDDRHSGGQGFSLESESAGDRSRSRPRLLQPPLPGGKGDWRLAPRDRPVNSEHLHSTDTVQDGDSSLRLQRCPRERSPPLPGLEGRVLPGARPPKFQEVSALRVTGDSVPVQGSLLRTVHCPPSLHESVRSSVSVGAHSRNSASPVLGRLAGSGLLEGQSPSARPRTSLIVSRSGDRGQREEVGSRALTLCELSAG